MNIAASWFETARSLSSGAHSRDPLAPPHHEGLPPLFLVGLEVGVGGAQFRHWDLGGLGARYEAADHVVGLDLGAGLDVAEHRRRQWRALGGEHPMSALEE